MGGAACAIPHQAILGSETSPPTDSHKWPVWDVKLRRCFEQSNIVSGLEQMDQEQPDQHIADTICTLLTKPSWTLDDRTALCNYLDALYDD